jgi:hypothetical protein
MRSSFIEIVEWIYREPSSQTSPNTENPRVGGSIPPLATIRGLSLRDCPHFRASSGKSPRRSLALFRWSALKVSLHRLARPD